MCACVWLGSSNLHSYKKNRSSHFPWKRSREDKKTNGFNTRRKRRWARRWSQMILCHPDRQSTAPQGREEERVNPSVKAYRSPAERRRRSQTNEFVSAQQWRLGCKRADNSVLWAKICHKHPQERFSMLKTLLYFLFPHLIHASVFSSQFFLILCFKNPVHVQNSSV